MKTFADAEARLAESLPGYESRAPQQLLAERIEHLLSVPAHFTPYSGPEEDYADWVRPDLTHLIGQAGTGTGKTLGYLIPAILSGRRVVVSVTTKALQSQLATKDVPFLAEHLGIDFSWAVLKGRSNYLCVNRAAMVTSSDVPELSEITELIQSDPDFDGDRESIERGIGHEISHQSWAQIGADSEECLDNNCDAATCYAERARATAQQSRIVIVNHALFLTDLVVKSWGRGGMLGVYDAVVFDEAHELEDVAGSALGSEIGEGSIMSLSAQVRRWAREHSDEGEDQFSAPLGDLTLAVEALFEALPNGRLTDGIIAESIDQFAAVYDRVQGLRDALKSAKSDLSTAPEICQKRRSSLYRLIGSVEDRVETVIAGAQTEYVRWVEETRTRRGETRKVIKISPINVAPFLFKNVFSKIPTALVSATLKVNGNFSYISSRLGIGPAVEGIDVGTPFDYPEQGRIYIPLSLPEPKGSDQAEWKAMATNEISRLVQATNGRALVLFTSVAHMNEAFVALQVMNPDLTFRKQYEAPPSDLVAWLKAAEAEEGRVLLGTKSFFTGVDIPGDALSLVIVTKMPFPRPGDPLVDARCEAIVARGGDSFGDYTIPTMSLVLQQALGRLIRHRSDRGVVAVLDPRLVSKGYGRRILADLPPMGRANSIEEIDSFIGAGK